MARAGRAPAMRLLHVRLMPWRWNGAVLTGGTPQQFAAWAKAYIGTDIETGDNSAGHAVVVYGKPWLIWVETLTNIPALAHEALHVTAGCLEERGLRFAPASEEAFTYTMEDLLRQVLDAKPSAWERAR